MTLFLIKIQLDWQNSKNRTIMSFKAEFTNPVSACVYRIALQFLLLTLIEQNQGK
jgi:hypothetical protein